MLEYSRLGTNLSWVGFLPVSILSGTPHSNSTYNDTTSTYAIDGEPPNLFGLANIPRNSQPGNGLHFQMIFPTPLPHPYY